ncbi:adenylate/guanylate cyclase domain-containing protein [Trichothermofontia sp.]
MAVSPGSKSILQTLQQRLGIGSLSASRLHNCSDAEIYRAWQRKFVWVRTGLALKLAIVVYSTFVVIGLWSPFNFGQLRLPWQLMAGVTLLSLVLVAIVHRSPLGRRFPSLIFLATSWSITLIEQLWATLNGFALQGLFAWTLVFLAQATIVPMRWQIHLIAQAGVLAYYGLVNLSLGLKPAEDRPLFDVLTILYLFWFCAIATLTVFRYEQLQQAQFRTRRQLEAAYCQIEAEKAQSERLLLNILPATVAQKLKQETTTIAESFPEVTVLFADIVGFTQLSASLPPTQLVSWLNQIFSAFDQLAESLQLEKIKTIGDAYMVVGGLPVERPDHAEAVAEMALGMQQVVTAFNAEHHQNFSLRIGINTGPVVAGVIGIKKFIYDLWGDTVNIASRMESQGLADCIQVTEATFACLRDRYQFKKRGTINVKGRGEMTTYLLVKRLDNDLDVDNDLDEGLD